MIPRAEHIAQARGKDDAIVREVDVSLHTDQGWFSAGRYRVAFNEEMAQGYWVGLALEEESEFVMSMSICSEIEKIPE